MSRKNLLDVNVLVALAEPGHQDYRKAQNWFDTLSGGSLGVCPLTEAGFVRVTTNSVYRPGPRTLSQATAILQIWKSLPGYWYWEMDQSWVTLTAPFASRIVGHRLVSDAYLLGLAIEEDGVLVTFDRGLKDLAGAQFSRHLFTIA